MARIRTEKDYGAFLATDASFARPGLQFGLPFLLVFSLSNDELPYGWALN
jgi:hypothetical protein